jgi:large subunit ribosomal protein L28
MSFRCDFCHKGVGYGHAVSHAKNRLKRLFKPNLQSLKVLKNGVSLRVRFCTHCIKKLKKVGRIGVYRMLVRNTGNKDNKVTISKPEIKKQAKKEKITEPVKNKTKTNEKNTATLNIDSIVGKKS